MLQFPPLPTWDSLHPLIIHFPIALLLLSPLFILISAIPPPPKGKPYMIAALLILLLGTASLFIAGSTGHAASELAERGGCRGCGARGPRRSGFGNSDCLCWIICNSSGNVPDSHRSSSPGKQAVFDLPSVGVRCPVCRRIAVPGQYSPCRRTACP